MATFANDSGLGPPPKLRLVGQIGNALQADFEDWRYPSDDGSTISSNVADLPKALAGLVTALTHTDFLALVTNRQSKRQSGA